MLICRINGTRVPQVNCVIKNKTTRHSSRVLGLGLVAAGGAAVGGYSYAANALEATRAVPLNRAWKAANATL